MDLDKLTLELNSLTEDHADPDAWEALYRTLWPYLIGILFRSLHGNRQMAEDAAQEVMLRVLRYANFRAGHRSSLSFLSFVKTLCRSVIVDLYRRQGVEPPAEDITETGLLTDRGPDPESAQITRDLIEKVAGRLSTEDLQMARDLVSGTPPDEAAAALHLNLPAYYKRVSRLRKRVRTILDTLSESA